MGESADPGAMEPERGYGADPARRDPATQPTFLYEGRRFLWGYTPDREACGVWDVDDPTGAPHQSWPISEHRPAWRVFRALEPHAVPYGNLDGGRSEAGARSSPAAGSEPGPIGTDAEPAPRGAPEGVVATDAVGEAEGLTAVDESASTGGRTADEVPVPGAVPARVETGGLGAGEVPVQGEAAVRPQGAGATANADADAGHKGVPRWRWALLIAVLVAVLVGGALFWVTRVSNSSTVANPGRAVLTAATTTQDLHTAHISMTETVSGLPSGTLTVPASGDLDFTTGASKLTMKIQGQQVSVITSGGTVYVSLPTVASLLPGKSWVSTPIGDAGSAASGALSGGDPAQMLQFLATEGNDVQPIGSSVVDGVAVNGYSVRINKSAVASRLATLGIPAPVVQAEERFLVAVGSIRYTVYVDTANRMRAMDFSMSVPVASQSATVAVSVKFSNFGAPVTVSVPPPSQVVSLQEFFQAAGVSSAS